MPRKLTLTLEPSGGTHNFFLAKINDFPIIKESGNKKRSWSGDIPDHGVKIYVSSMGMGNAQYKVSIDLPGTTDDHNGTYTLDGGFHEITIII
ncbi:MAG: hypothetical protein ABJG78_12645 [Cyclobacteriaceae bacterium]